MSNQITSTYMKLPIMSVFLGSCLLLLTHPAQGQISKSNKILLSQTVLENLPPPPDYAQNQPVEFFNQYQQEQYPYNQSFQRYSVYVESNSEWTLQQIRQNVEPSAYFRQLNGRSVIQSGVFNEQGNAQQRVRQLNAIGVYGARIVSDGQQIPSNPGNGNTGNVGSKSRYYVTIPTKPQDLSIVANQVRQVTGLYGLVAEKRQPLGPHVAIGPFRQRTEAESWNNIVRDRGFGNARVYYDR
ncbi:hypothetical protein CLI64_07680 [Nostoc sp. CENA543]|uniref:hypothetical protein n=1 Tax=Nostoc sp. CENA543 TaxID=1869241 RepID=UPI000CA339A2|nr:hypothetical protein [Nostoc sp. CENA543]AUT00274.1 hypothetical protein CLI64_07680 [Nostoc sp. CENA543]